MTASRLKVRYALALVLAQVLAAVELTALILPLRHHLVPALDTVFQADTTIAAITLSILGFGASIGYAVLVVDRKLSWFTAGEAPSPQDRAFVERLLRSQSALLAAI